MKRKLAIDWCLIPLFILSAYTGIMLHAAGHGNSHEIWHDRAVLHIIASSAFLIVGILHITTHWSWYRGIINRGIGKKSKVTLGLSVTFLFVVATGVVLLDIDGGNSDIGLWHYKTGIVAGVFSVAHVVKRIPALSRSIKNRNNM